jgi:hypothetical protein
MASGAEAAASSGACSWSRDQRTRCTQAHCTQHGEVGALGGAQVAEQLVGLVERFGREHQAGVTVIDAAIRSCREFSNRSRSTNPPRCMPLVPR